MWQYNKKWLSDDRVIYQHIQACGFGALQMIQKKSHSDLMKNYKGIFMNGFNYEDVRYMDDARKNKDQILARQPYTLDRQRLTQLQSNSCSVIIALVTIRIRID